MVSGGGGGGGGEITNLLHGRHKEESELHDALRRKKRVDALRTEREKGCCTDLGEKGSAWHN